MKQGGGMKEKKGKKQEQENKSNGNKTEMKHGICGICSDREYSFFILPTPTPYLQPPPL